jgi:hypothetical protein
VSARSGQGTGRSTSSQSEIKRLEEQLREERKARVKAEEQLEEIRKAKSRAASRGKGDEQKEGGEYEEFKKAVASGMGAKSTMM